VPTPDQYTPELGKQLYGDTVAGAIEAAQINPLAMAQKVYAGQDASSDIDALVEKDGPAARAGGDLSAGRSAATQGR